MTRTRPATVKLHASNPVVLGAVRGTGKWPGKGLLMSVEQDENEERPCLHCLMVDLIDDFFAEYKATSGEGDAVDPDEVIVAIAKTVAELTSSQDSTLRQKIIEQVMSKIMEYDAEFRKENEM